MLALSFSACNSLLSPSVRFLRINFKSQLTGQIRGSALCRSAKSVNVAVLLRSECEPKAKSKRTQPFPALAQRLSHSEYDTAAAHHTDHLDRSGGISSGEYELLEDAGETEFQAQQKRVHRFR
jgi:hypothetical protein